MKRRQDMRYSIMILLMGCTVGLDSSYVLDKDLSGDDSGLSTDEEGNTTGNNAGGTSNGGTTGGNSSVEDCGDGIDNDGDTVFENSSKLQINNCTNDLKNKYFNKKIFKNVEDFEEVMDDMYLFLQIIKNNKCEFDTNKNKLILAIIPIFSVINKLGEGEVPFNNIREQICKINNLIV